MIPQPLQQTIHKSYGGGFLWESKRVDMLIGHICKFGQDSFTRRYMWDIICKGHVFLGSSLPQIQLFQEPVFCSSRGIQCLTKNDLVTVGSFHLFGGEMLRSCCLLGAQLTLTGVTPPPWST